MAAEEGHLESAVFLSPIPSISSNGSSNYGKKNISPQHHNNNNNNHSDYVDGGGAAATGDAQQHDGHHPDQQHFSFLQSIFSSSAPGTQSEAQGRVFNSSNSSTHSHLAPPSQYDIGRRRSSNSSIDSYAHNDRRRGSYRGGSSHRFSGGLVEETSEAATLMTFVHSTSHALKRTRKALRRAFRAVFVIRPSRPRLVCEAEVMEQVGWVCKDYIVARLVARDLMSRRTGIVPTNWPQSRHVVAAGSALEALYPRIYSNVSRKLCLTMSSPKLVRNTLIAVLEVMFECSITWAKIVSMMAVAGLYAEECASQGHPDFVHEVVEAVLDFTAGHLLPWLVSQGGWDGFPLPEGSEGSRLSMFRLLLVSGAATTLVLVRYYLLTYYPVNQQM